MVNEATVEKVKRERDGGWGKNFMLIEFINIAIVHLRVVWSEAHKSHKKHWKGEREEISHSFLFEQAVKNDSSS